MNVRERFATVKNVMDYHTLAFRKFKKVVSSWDAARFKVAHTCPSPKAMAAHRAFAHENRY